MAPGDRIGYDLSALCPRRGPHVIPRNGGLTLKAAVTDGKGSVWIEDVPAPEPNDYQCLCRMLACATCTGTDRKHIQDKLPWRQDYPGILGHESIGEVVEVGAKVTAFGRGDLVLRPTAVYPGERLGGFSSLWGGFAEYGLVTDAAAMRRDDPSAETNNYVRFQQKLPPDLGVSPADATMVITLKETASYVASVGVKMLTSAVILGAGSVAFSMCRFAKVFGGSPVIVVGRRDEPLAHARKLGADVTINAREADVAQAVRDATDGEGADIMIDATGNAEFAKACMPALAADGVVAFYATYPADDTTRETLDPARVRRGSTAEDAAHPYMMDAVRLGLVNLADFYSHRMPLAEIAEAFDMLDRKKAFKIVLEMEA